jgi:hypothetical protein
VLRGVFRYGRQSGTQAWNRCRGEWYLGCHGGWCEIESCDGGDFEVDTALVGGRGLMGKLG